METLVKSSMCTTILFLDKNGGYVIVTMGEQTLSQVVNIKNYAWSVCIVKVHL